MQMTSNVLCSSDVFTILSVTRIAINAIKEQGYTVTISS